MASTDVIRSFARRRLSCIHLYLHWFEHGAIGTRDLNRGHDLLREVLAKNNGSSHHPTHIRAVTVRGLINLETEAAGMEAVSESGGGTDGGGPTATMASQDPSPSPPASGVFAGGGRDGDCIYPFSSNSFSDYSVSQIEDIFVEELSALTLANDSTAVLCTGSCAPRTSERSAQEPENHSKITNPLWDECVAELLRVLRQFGVASNPVPYRPLEKRLDSTEIFCKNLFLKDRKGQFFLVICDENKNMDLKWLRKKLKAYRNLSFATAEEMTSILLVQPGGVTPFALMHGPARDVRVVMTTDLTFDRNALLNFHPLDQKLTLPVQLVHLELFLQNYRFEIEYIDVDDFSQPTQLIC